MTTHPDELLAAYVDGALSPTDRAAVDAHVSGCDRCRHEVALAGAARSALTAIPEVPAPAGVADRALAEAGLARARAGSGPPRWYRVAGIAAAVAAVALVLVVILPNPKGGDRTLSADSAVGGAEAGGVLAPAAAESSIEVRDADYAAADLGGLIAPYQRDLTGAEATAQGRAGTDAETRRALECVHAAAPDAAGGLAQLIQARFEGRPAYFALFLEGPGAGQPNDKGTVWVVSRRDCTILSFAQAKL